MSTVIRSDHLECTKGTSDKLYTLTMSEDPTSYDRYEIVASYGRRGSVLNVAKKGKFHYRTDANTLYDKTLDEKLNKGYTGVEIRTVNTKKPSKAEKQKLKQLEQNIDEGIRRIEFEL